MRAYVPATLPMLGSWHASGLVDVTVAYAVTSALREWYGGDDVEELEYAALTAAARGSLRLLAGDPAAPRRRVVVALDVPHAAPDERAGTAVVRLDGPVPIDAVAAVHVDGADAAPTVAEAVGALDAGLADPAAARAVEALEDLRLAWFATQEIPDLVR